MKIIILLALIGSWCVAFGQQAADPVGAWMPVNAKWQHAPADAAPELLTASTLVLYFQPDGKMVKIGCIVNREPGRFITISAGDGQTVSAGEWHEEHGKVVARSQLIFRTVSRVGEQLPGPWNREVLTLKNGQLILKGVNYKRVPELDLSAAEMVPHPSPIRP